MEPNEFLDCIDTLNWSVCGLARRLNVDENRVRRWASGRYQVPEELAVWLNRLVDTLQRYPAPILHSDQKKG